jgi:hypothetical protein
MASVSALATVDHETLKKFVRTRKYFDVLRADVGPVKALIRT